MDSLHDKLKNKEDRIQQLIDLLQRTDAELQELAGGELDAELVTLDAQLAAVTQSRR